MCLSNDAFGRWQATLKPVLCPFWTVGRQAYGFNIKDTSEEICIEKLMKMYQSLIKKNE